MKWTYWNNTDVNVPWEFDTATELFEAVENYIPYRALLAARADPCNIFSEFIRAPDDTERIRTGSKSLRKPI